MEIGPDMYKADGDRAVSPVIGVILMVAITVILAAVIAAFVLGIGPGDDPVEAAVDVDGDGTDELEIAVSSADNADYIVVTQDGDICEDGAIEATTGSSGTVSESDVDGCGFDSNDEYDVTIWAILGDDPDNGGPDDLDAADGTLELADASIDDTS